MQLPKSIRVGKTRYPVVQPFAMIPPTHAGSVTYGHNIRVALTMHTGSRLAVRSERQRSETFWHEVTHAILHDMGSKLEANEQFVTAFSKRLNDAIRSAKF
jgi:hypothetical protein